MTPLGTPLDLSRVRVYPLPSRTSLTGLDDIRIDPDAAPRAAPSPHVAANIEAAAAAMRRARDRGATRMLIYGAHLLRNGAAPLVERLLDAGWLTHLATNGAGTIHDWEFAWHGRTSESVRDGVAHGRFGTWEETGRAVNLAVQVGGARGEGFGRSMGRLIAEDGLDIPTPDDLLAALRAEPEHPLASARADLLRTLRTHVVEPGRWRVEHPHKRASIVWQAFCHQVPLTVHPGIGYDIYCCHPAFNGAAIGRGADHDFRTFAGELLRLDDGAVLSVGSAIMGPQVFEKSLSCANNLRLQDGRPAASRFEIHVVDLQDGGDWDWSQGEPPKTNPAYYLRFCKSYARMGGTMRYSQCDNVLFLHHLWRRLAA